MKPSKLSKNIESLNGPLPTNPLPIQIKTTRIAISTSVRSYPVVCAPQATLPLPPKNRKCFSPSYRPRTWHKMCLTSYWSRFWQSSETLKLSREVSYRQSLKNCRSTVKSRLTKLNALWVTTLSSALVRTKNLLWKRFGAKCKHPPSSCLMTVTLIFDFL